MPTLEYIVFILMVGLVGLVITLISVMWRWQKAVIDSKVDKEGYIRWSEDIEKEISKKLNHIPFYDDIMKRFDKIEMKLDTRCAECAKGIILKEILSELVKRRQELIERTD